jgi:hypothetical protein
VTDIFREVEEEVRRERLEKLWKQYGDYVIAAASIIVIAAAGYQLWRYHEAQARAKASSDYMAAQQLLDSGQTQAAAKAFAQIGQDAPGGYARIAELQQADALLASGDRTNALTVYQRIAAGDDEMLSAIARVRIGWATVETAPKGELESELAPLTAANSPWRSMAREILAYSDYRNGLTKAALGEFKSLAGDANGSPGVRQRAKAMVTMITAGGDANYGSVPIPQMALPKPPMVTMPMAPQGAAPANGGAAANPAAPNQATSTAPNSRAAATPAPPAPQGPTPK